jgi:hypothetical protein
MSNVLEELSEWPIRLVDDETTIHVLQQVKLTLENVIVSIRKVCCIRVVELVLNYKTEINTEH